MDEQLIEQLVQNCGIEPDMARAALQANQTRDIEQLFAWVVDSGEEWMAKQKKQENKEIKESQKQVQQTKIQAQKIQVTQNSKTQLVSASLPNQNPQIKQLSPQLEQNFKSLCQYGIQKEVAQAVLKINPKQSLQEQYDWCVTHVDDWQTQLKVWQQNQQKAKQTEKQKSKIMSEHQNDEQVVKQLMNFGVAQNLARQSLKNNSSRQISELFQWCQLAESSQFSQFGNVNQPNLQKPMTEQEKVKKMIEEGQKLDYNSEQIKQKLKGILRRVRQIRKQRMPQQRQLRKQYLARYGATEEQAKKKIYAEIAQRRQDEKRRQQQEQQEKIREYQKMRMRQDEAEQQRMKSEDVVAQMKGNQMKSDQMNKGVMQNQQPVRLTQQEQKFKGLANQLQVLNKAKTKASEKVKTAYETLEKILNKIIDNFDVEKYRKMRETNLQDKLIGDDLNGEGILQQMGFEKIGQYFILPESARTVEQLKTMLGIIKKYQNTK